MTRPDQKRDTEHSPGDAIHAMPSPTAYSTEFPPSAPVQPKDPGRRRRRSSSSREKRRRRQPSHLKLRPKAGRYPASGSRVSGLGGGNQSSGGISLFGRPFYWTSTSRPGPLWLAAREGAEPRHTHVKPSVCFVAFSTVPCHLPSDRPSVCVSSRFYCWPFFNVAVVPSANILRFWAELAEHLTDDRRRAGGGLISVECYCS